MRRVVLKQGIWDSRICLFNYIYIYIFFYQKQRLLPQDKYSLELATPSPAPHTNPNIIGEKKKEDWCDQIESNNSTKPLAFQLPTLILRHVNVRAPSHYRRLIEDEEPAHPIPSSIALQPRTSKADSRRYFFPSRCETDALKVGFEATIDPPHVFGGSS